MDQASLRQLWDGRAQQAAEEVAHNPFSEHFDAAASKQHPQRSDADYGRPVEGSKTAARAQQAQAWVEQNVMKLVEVIRELSQGTSDAQSRPYTTFGELFAAYVNISDTLVGIMLRAKKRGLIEYEGAMLFQGMHDHVRVTLLQ